jgi:GTP1/Obg family GTP-binding protein
MRLFVRSLAAAILTAGWCLFIPTVNVLAQSTLLDPSTSTANLLDQKLSAVAAALERIASLQKDYRQRVAEAEVPADKDRIVAEAHGEFTKAVTDQGLSLEEYASILDMARDDPQIRGKLLQRIRPPYK